MARYENDDEEEKANASEDIERVMAHQTNTTMLPAGDSSTNRISISSGSGSGSGSHSTSYGEREGKDDVDLPLKVAIVGCSHGELDEIYRSIEYIDGLEGREQQGQEQSQDAGRNNTKIELLIVCGDFQCLRNEEDMQCLACPAKYRAMGTFHEYYTGVKKAPVMTVFIGGNHEASNFLQELHYGGWIAPNMFFLGTAGVINYGGLRIAGLSGIYKQHDYPCGHYERFPYTESTLRSVYHVREYEVFQMGHLKEHVDVFVSHDWPRGISYHGNTAELLRKKDFLREEVRSNTLGNPATEYLLHKLQPSYWFSGHLHVKFAAVVHHSEGKDGKTTKFLALDKCLPNKDFMQVLSIHRRRRDDRIFSRPYTVEIDPEWMAVIRATHHLASTVHYPARPPQVDFPITPQEIAWIQTRYEELFSKSNENSDTFITSSSSSTSSTSSTTSGMNSTATTTRLEWPWSFQVTARPLKSDTSANAATMSEARGNPQTDGLLAFLKLPHVVTVPYDSEAQSCLSLKTNISWTMDEKERKDVFVAAIEQRDRRRDDQALNTMEEDVNDAVVDPNAIDIDDL